MKPRNPLLQKKALDETMVMWNDPSYAEHQHHSDPGYSTQNGKDYAGRGSTEVEGGALKDGIPANLLSVELGKEAAGSMDPIDLLRRAADTLQNYAANDGDMNDSLAMEIEEYLAQLPQPKQAKVPKSVLTGSKSELGKFSASAAPAIANQDITRTQTFKTWFGNSKVVNKHGTPQVMYHATQTEGIEVFRPFTHFGTQGAAADRDQALKEFYNDVVKFPSRYTGANVVPVFLSVTNPLRMPDLAAVDMNSGESLEGYEPPGEDNEDGEEGRYPRSWEGEEAVATTLLEMGIIDIDEFEDHRGNDEALMLLIDKGYDGIVYKNVVEDKGNDSWIVFRPNQIKSAIGNTGEFNPENAGITGSTEPDPESATFFKESEPNSPFSTTEEEISNIINGQGFQYGARVDDGTTLWLRGRDERISFNPKDGMVTYSKNGKAEMACPVDQLAVNIGRMVKSAARAFQAAIRPSPTKVFQDKVDNATGKQPVVPDDPNDDEVAKAQMTLENAGVGDQIGVNAGEEKTAVVTKTYGTGTPPGGTPNDPSIDDEEDEDKTAGAKTAEIGIHETPKFLPPRNDIRRHLDEQVQDEVMEGVMDEDKTADAVEGEVVRREGNFMLYAFPPDTPLGQYGEIKRPAPKHEIWYVGNKAKALPIAQENWGPLTHEQENQLLERGSLNLPDIKLRLTCVDYSKPTILPKKKLQASDADDVANEYYLDTVRDMKDEAKQVFMEDTEMQQVAVENGMTMEDLWLDVGEDFTQNYYESAYAKQASIEVEEEFKCPNCKSTKGKAVKDGVDDAQSLRECLTCRSFYQL